MRTSFNLLAAVVAAFALDAASALTLPRAARPRMQASTASALSVPQAAQFFAANPGVDAATKKAFLVDKGVSDFVIAQAECTATGMESTVHGHPGEGGEGIDFVQLLKYPVATVGEFALISAVLRAVDAVCTLPTFCVPPLFFFLSLRSRIFSLLPASRPKRAEQDGNATPKEVKRPSWTPPGIAFPFIWLTISCLRAASSTLVWSSTGRMLSAPPSPCPRPAPLRRRHVELCHERRAAARHVLARRLCGPRLGLRRRRHLLQDAAHRGLAAGAVGCVDLHRDRAHMDHLGDQ